MVARSSLAILAGGWLLAGCSFDGSAGGERGAEEGELPGNGLEPPTGGLGPAAEPCRVSGSAVGVAPVPLSFDGVRITVLRWRADSRDPGRFVGFDLASNVSTPRFTVYAGERTFSGAGLSWRYPNSSRSVPSIAAVDFCATRLDGESADREEEEE